MNYIDKLIEMNACAAAVAAAAAYAAYAAVAADAAAFAADADIVRKHYPSPPEDLI